MAEPLKGRVWKLEVEVATMQDTIIALSKQIDELKKYTFQEDEIENRYRATYRASARRIKTSS